MRLLSTILITCLISTALAVLISHFVLKPKQEALINDGLGFTYAAAKGKSVTVFIYNLNSDTATVYSNQQTGSGVIISPDGYIVTNQHVIHEAIRIHVYMDDRREFEARLVGADTLKDIALLKIQADSLPYLSFGNSDSIQIGEQVLAVGNPLRLQSTVTSGIISAKDRELQLPGNNTPRFIQTDVPINLGNSGGALINYKGELIGLNVAIVSMTGAYEGFSFAIPGNLVKKISDDHREYGVTRQGSIRMTIRPVNHEIANQAGMMEVYGVVVESVIEGGAADKAGLQSFDILLTVNGERIVSNAMFQEMLAEHRPGDILSLEILRNRKLIEVVVTLM